MSKRKIRKLTKKLDERQKAFDEIKPSPQFAGKTVSQGGHQMHRPGSMRNRP